MLVLGDIKVTLFIQNPVVCGLITVLWIVGITNAFNLLDNMDGLSAGVAMIVSVILLIVAVQTAQYFLAALLLVLLGSIVGFLIYNFPPASIFMGDTGSLFIGYMLAASAVLLTFYKEGYGLFPIVVPLIVFCVPLFDTAGVILIRLRAGRSIFEADKNHFSHRLVRLGMTPRKAVLVIYLLTFATGLMATLLYHTTNLGAAIILVQVVTVIVIIALLEGTRSNARNADET